MKIRSTPTPTPIASAGAAQQRKEGQPKQIAPTVGPPKPEGQPLVIDLGEKKIELQRGELARVIDKMNETVRIFNHSIRFQLADDEVHIKVIDTASGEVVREIPPEKLLDAFNRVEDILGLLLDVRL